MGRRKLKKNQKAVKEPKFPIKPFNDYKRELKKELIEPIRKEMEKTDLKNSILKNEILDEIALVIGIFERIYKRKSKKIEKIVRSFVNAVKRIHEKRFKAGLKKEEIEIKERYSEDVKEAVKRRIEYNVSLIKSANERAKAKLKEALFRNLELGNPEAIRDIVFRELRGYSNNLELIARDQTLKFSKDLTKVKAKKMGVTQYVYRTSQDEKVRPTHARLNKRIFDLEEDNEGNKRLIEINCRCHREIIFNLD